jgi:hypothetical protein
VPEIELLFAGSGVEKLGGELWTGRREKKKPTKGKQKESKEKS